MIPELPNTEVLIGCLKTGDRSALGTLWDFYRPRLKRMVHVHLDSRLAARVDASDVVQDTYLDAQKKLPSYLEDPKVAFYVWLRVLAHDRLAKIHRQHLGTQCRAADREVQLPADASAVLASQIAAHGPSPSQSLREGELIDKIQRALHQLPPDDREIVLMRHFEEMTNGEVAQALGLTNSAATMRYGRALLHLKKLLTEDTVW